MNAQKVGRRRQVTCREPRRLKQLLGGIMLIGALPTAMAQVADFEYESDGVEITLTAYLGPGGDVTVPSTIGGLPITGIAEWTFAMSGDLTGVILPEEIVWIGPYAFFPSDTRSLGPRAFSGSAMLTNVHIPEGLVEVGEYAFEGCRALVSVAIPGSIERVASGMFESCIGLTRVTLAEGVTEIGSGAFGSCTGLVEANLPSSLRRVEDSAFQACLALRELVFPDGLAMVGNSALLGCEALTSVWLPDSLVSLGHSVFAQCNGLRSARLPEALENFNAWLFAGCASLAEVNIPGSLTVIGRGAFSSCAALTRVELSDKVTRIESYAFANCTGLRELNLGRNLAEIEREAFAGCTGLGRVWIPGRLTKMDGNVFAGCTSLTAIDVDDSNPVYRSVDGVLFNKVGDTLLLFPPGRTGSYQVPDHVNNVGTGAFFKCARLSRVDLPESLTRLEGWAFHGCANLTRMEIPAGLIWMGDSAISACTRLEDVRMVGDAPIVEAEGSTFTDSPAVIVYYRAGTSGWGQTFEGRPTAPWIEPPVYGEWVQLTDLPLRFPGAMGEDDDPDGDGMTNYAEMLAGTDPTEGASRLVMELWPRPEDLTEADRMPVNDGQDAVYFRSMPGKRYAVQWTDVLQGPWQVNAVLIATTTQT